MSKTLGYYTDSSTALDELQDQFGSRLETLEKFEKLHLLAILAEFMQAVLVPHLQPEDFNLEAVLYDLSPYAPSERVALAVEILDRGTFRPQAVYGMMQAIAAQLNGG